MSDMRVLIVEQDPDLRDLLMEILRLRGHDVTTCQDAETACATYEREAFPLVLLDWRPPQIDGLQLCRQLRAFPKGDHSIILVLTERDKAEDLQAVLDAGADDYLAKPMDIKLLNVRLVVAERQVTNLTERKRAEAKLVETHKQLEQSHEDTLSIMNQVNLGAAMTDEEGRVRFLSRSGQELFGKDDAKVLGKRWELLGPFEDEDKAKLEAMLTAAPDRRSKVPVEVDIPGRGHCWMEVDIQDDPRDPRSKIFYFYDTTELHSLRRLLGEKAQFRDLVGKSRPMKTIYQQIQQLAGLDTTVMIEGETGTGKELVARAIHFSSQRESGPFIPVNCAGLAESLVESQLFGHKRGAFTGAIETHQGLFESANGGTIFLDEIGDLPPTVQTRMLRVLQEREIVRVGESKPRKINVRVLAATHHDLAKEVEKGNFRQDLFYRIQVARIHMPPLRDHREDIPLLVGLFLRQFNTVSGKDPVDVSPQAMAKMLEHDWPGNVRELQNAVEFSVTRCDGLMIQPRDLPPEISDMPTPAFSPEGPYKDEKELVEAALKSAGGNRSKAAKLLGVSRATLYRRLAKLGFSASH